jgi:hypothetical protein
MNKYAIRFMLYLCIFVLFGLCIDLALDCADVLADKLTEKGHVKLTIVGIPVEKAESEQEE